MFSFEMAVPNPSNFAHLQARVTQSSQRAFYRVGQGSLGRAVRIEGKPYFIEISASSPESTTWFVTCYGCNRTQEFNIREKITHLFSLDTELDSFYRHAAHDPVMTYITEQFCGARLMRDEDLFIASISSVISQQLNLGFAAELKRRLWHMAGEAVEVEDETFYADPLPEAVAILSYDQLRSLQFSQRKAEYVIDLARAIVDGRFDLDAIRQMSDEEAIHTLSQLRGLGRWTAECILLFGLGRPDLLPAKDIGLMKSVTRFWHLPQRITEDGLRQMAEDWRPWRSWYTYYLWLALSLP